MIAEQNEQQTRSLKTL